MEYLILIILAVVVFYYFNKDEAEDKHDEANLEKFSDDYYKFLEKATSLKKEGDLEGAIKNIAKAISISPDITSVYKMAYYLHLDGQFDESWKVLMSHTTIIRELLFASDNWEKSNELLIEYVACEEGLIKLLKKQKKTKEVLYYSPAAEFYNLLTMATQYYSDFQETLKEHAKGSISERRKIKSNKYDLSIFLMLCILPTASMWPWQICPDIFWPNFKGSSRFILSFIFRNLNFDLCIVSSER